MRKFMISMAVAGSTLALAAPASAQWAPQPHAGYATPYAYSHAGVGHNLHARVQGLRHQIRDLAARRLIAPRQAHSLDRQAANIERQMLRPARLGVNPRQHFALERRVARLEQRLQRLAFRNSNSYRYGNRAHRGYRY